RKAGDPESGVRRLLLPLLALLGAAAPAAAQQSDGLRGAVEPLIFRYHQSVHFYVSRGDQYATSGDGLSLYGYSQETGRGGVIEATFLDPWRFVSRQLLAVMVMQQVEAGRLSLDMPAATYLPELHDMPRAPTIMEL